MRTDARRIRIGDWLVPYDDAPGEVLLERTAMDILLAKSGKPSECMNSRCIMAQRNAHIFPHPVLLVSTIRSRVYIVDRMDDAGIPAHAYRYQLTPAGSRQVAEHDRNGVAEPGVLRLKVPKDPKGSPQRKKYGGGYADQTTKHYGGDERKVSPTPKRPVTAFSWGVRHRYVAAVGALVESHDA